MITGENKTLLSPQLDLCFTLLQMGLLSVLHFSVIYYILRHNEILVSSKSAEGAQNAGLGLIIFMALLLHKAPAALGFGSFLRHEAIPNNLLIKHLLVRMITI
jgi:hypothetical protein